MGLWSTPMLASRQTQNALRDASLHFGIVGALAFVVFILIFREDWTDKYRNLRYLLPLPWLLLLLGKRFSLAGGLLLVILGIGVAVFDMFFTPAHPGQIAGRGLGYTIAFVTVPLLISGGLHIVHGWKSR